MTAISRHGDGLALHRKSKLGELSAGVVVFLVALPLCVGIALASGVPLVSSLMCSAIAGLIVTWLSGSVLSVSGPAAGLTWIIAAAITRLGSFEAVLVAIFLAGFLQVLFGVLRVGVLASFVPYSVIKGMIAAVGLIIILKQIPHAVGWDSDFEGDESFAQFVDHDNTYSAISHALDHMEAGAMAVSLVALATMVLWHAPMIQRRRSIAVIPAPLLGVLMGTLVNELLCHFVPNVGLTAVSGHLLQIPDGGIKGLFMQLPTPRWDVITRADTWDIALAIALIASVESLLSVEATDKMAPDHPHANVHRELMAQGVGNMLCGAVGALPMASVMLRNSANIYGGGESRWPSFFHGILLLVAVALVPDILEHIPLAALAVVIIHVGARLININMVRQVWREGVEQIAPFWVTFVAIMVTDLAVGVAIGMAVGLLIVLRMNHHSAMTVVRDGDDMLVRFAKDVSFVQKSALKGVLNEIPAGVSVTIDGTGAQFIDHDIIEVVRDFEMSGTKRGIKIHLKNLRTKRMVILGVRDGKLQEPLARK